MSLTLATIIWLMTVLGLLCFRCLKTATAAAQQRRLSLTLRRAMGLEEAAS